MSTSEIVRRCFAAYENKDREAIEELVGPDFTFSSPLDDNIDRKTYFERCWPNSGHQKRFEIVRIFEQGNEAFATYECETTEGKIFRNTEFFQVENGRLKHVDVYFGSE